MRRLSILLPLLAVGFAYFSGCSGDLPSAPQALDPSVAQTVRPSATPTPRKTPTPYYWN